MSHQMQSWGIIGLGWLGEALADQLKTEGHNVWGTHRETYTFGRDPFPKNPCDILFLNTPPILNLTPLEFVNHVSVATTSTRIIFISSTSVYGTDQGVCDESTSASPSTANGQWLLDVERLLQKKYTDRLLVIRPGGLIGGQRHPIFHFQSGHIYPGGQDRINMIHRLDLVSIIRATVRVRFTGVLNAVSVHHPTKSEYYKYWCHKLNKEVLLFEDSRQSSKIVESLYLQDLYSGWICPRLDFL